MKDRSTATSSRNTLNCATMSIGIAAIILEEVSSCEMIRSQQQAPCSSNIQLSAPCAPHVPTYLCRGSENVRASDGRRPNNLRQYYAAASIYLHLTYLKQYMNVRVHRLCVAHVQHVCFVRSTHDRQAGWRFEQHSSHCIPIHFPLTYLCYAQHSDIATLIKDQACMDCGLSLLELTRCHIFHLQSFDYSSACMVCSATRPR